MTSLSLAVGTGNPAELETLTLLANGVTVATGTFSGGTVTFTINETLGGSGSVTYTVVTGFSITAAGTYQVNAVSATGTNGQAVGFSGLPVTGSLIDVAAPTTTLTPTVTSTPTLVAQPTCVAPYPNPVVNGPVSVHVSVPGTTVVKWSVFTLSFRKIVGGEIQITNNGVIVWDLKDQYGKQVSDGLYYLRVEMDGLQSMDKIYKILILK